MAKHATLGASGSGRWLPCPGSIQLAARTNSVRESSSYASQGHAAHALAEWALTTQTPASQQLGEVIKTDEGVEHQVTADMVAAVQVYVDLCRQLIAGADAYGIEAQINLDALTKFYGIDVEAFGTADFWALTGDLLHIADYKHGKGLPVSAVENSQTMYYGLGVLFSVLTPEQRAQVKTARLTIVQPRTGDPPTESWDISVSDLTRWGLDVLVPGMARTLEPNPPLRPGPWCKSYFCAARVHCPARRASALELAQTEFSALPPDAVSLTTVQLGQLLDRAELMESFISDVRKEALSRAQQGDIPPGWKVAAKRATRTWVDPDKLADLIKDLPECFTEPSVRSVAQVEKVLQATHPYLWHRLEQDHVTKRSSGETLVPEGSARERVAKLPPGQEFA